MNKLEGKSSTVVTKKCIKIKVFGKSRACNFSWRLSEFNKSKLLREIYS